MFSRSRMESTPAEIDALVSLIRLAPGARVLDVGCGIGRHSLELARRGFRVTGVDRTPAYLEQARAAAKAESLDAEFVEGDMRALDYDGGYDAVLSLFTSFGFFEDQEDDRRTARGMCAALRPGGRLALDTAGKEILARIFRERDWHEEDGILVLQERELRSGWDWIKVRWVLIDGDRRVERRIEHRLYAASELGRLFLDTGFSSWTAYGGVDGRPYNQTAERLVFVAEK
jgi:SAM-dependent methyltransferase